MAKNKVTIKLTEEQQKQIKAATGHTLKELNIEITATGELSEQALNDVAGGAMSGDESPKETRR